MFWVIVGTFLIVCIFLFVAITSSYNLKRDSEYWDDYDDGWSS